MYHTIITHKRPHLDEISAIWLLRKFGDSKFPGVSIAKIEYWSGGNAPDGRNAEEYEKDGILLLGVGGGRFDEHPNADEGRKKDECAFTLVAKSLEVYDDLALERIIKFVTNNDLRGSIQPFDLAGIIRSYQEQNSDNQEAITQWISFGLDVAYEKQRLFVATEKEFKQAAKIEEIPGPNGKTLKMVTIVSDNEQMAQFARSEQGCKAAIVIQKNTAGNVAILTSQKFGLALFDVARMIRLAEQLRKGKIVTADWKTLSSEGKIDGAEEWFFHHKLQALLNGSLTAPDTPPTKIPLDVIGETVRVGLNPDSFEPERAEDCKSGICTSTPSNSCPWYAWGLVRCRAIRWAMKQPK